MYCTRSFRTYRSGRRRHLFHLFAHFLQLFLYSGGLVIALYLEFKGLVLLLESTELFNTADAGRVKKAPVSAVKVGTPALETETAHCCFPMVHILKGGLSVVFVRY